MDSARGTGISVLIASVAPLLDQETIRRFRESGGTIQSAVTQSAAIQAIESGVYDLIVLDLDSTELGPAELVDSARCQSVNGGRPFVVWNKPDLDREILDISQAFGFDLASALANAGEDPQLFRELIAIFLQECPRMLDDLRRSLASGEFDKLEMAAHKLKGGLTNFGAPGAVNAALEVEDAARRHDLSSSRGALLKLELVVLQLLRTLEQLP